MFHYRAEAQDAAIQHGLNPDLVIAVCLVESGGVAASYRYEPVFWTRYMRDKSQWHNAVPERVSASYGLMQVMYPVACELGYTGEPETLCVPTIGLDYGCRKLAQTLKWAKGDVASALAAYNGGMTRDNAPGATPKRNQRYVDKVLQRLPHENR